MARVNYDQIAPEYDRRFVSSELEERGKALLALANLLRAERILEAGCGTAHWLSALRPVTHQLVGLDYSDGMLRQAQQRQAGLELVRGSGDRLPFCAQSFDLVYCVDAIHHFPDQAGFISQAMEILHGGGILAVLGMDPHNPKNSWYANDFFDGMLETDLKRFPSHATLLEWMKSAGFVNIQVAEVERLDETRIGAQVLSDPYLKKNSCSQMALLSDEVHQAGMARLSAAVEAEQARGASFIGRTVLCIDMISGQKEALV